VLGSTRHRWWLAMLTWAVISFTALLSPAEASFQLKVSQFDREGISGQTGEPVTTSPEVVDLGCVEDSLVSFFDGPVCDEHGYKRLNFGQGTYWPEIISFCRGWREARASQPDGDLSRSQKFAPDRSSSSPLPPLYEFFQPRFRRLKGSIDSREMDGDVPRRRSPHVSTGNECINRNGLQPIRAVSESTRQFHIQGQPRSKVLRRNFARVIESVVTLAHSGVGGLGASSSGTGSPDCVNQNKSCDTNGNQIKVEGQRGPRNLIAVCLKRLSRYAKGILCVVFGLGTGLGICEGVLGWGDPMSADRIKWWWLIGGVLCFGSSIATIFLLP
jgi:hypothetical protein